MLVFIFSIILIFVVDTLLVGISFYALKNRFSWKLTPKLCFIILIVIFALLENYTTPLILILDATITIRNSEIANFFELTPNYPVINFFGFGFFDFVIWSIQAFFAGIIGEKLFNKNEMITKRK